MITIFRKSGGTSVVSQSYHDDMKARCEDGSCGDDDTSLHVADCAKLPIRFASTSERRVENNLMRHQYRLLTEDEKSLMQSVKDRGLEFVRLLHACGGTLAEFESEGQSARLKSRELSLAQTKIEEAVMWAVKHVTG